MFDRRRRTRSTLAVTLFALLSAAAPSAAEAWTVTVRIHGAGGVTEVANKFGEDRNQMDCSVNPSSTTTETSTPINCVGGTPSGLYNSSNVVRLAPSLPTDGAAYRAGWRFHKWVDSGAGGGLINCDPQNVTGDQMTPTYCEFQIFENLTVDLYFKDDFGPQDTSLSGGPDEGATVSSSSATFNFDAPSDPNASFHCRLSRRGGATGLYQHCGNAGDKSETYSNLTTDGVYDFFVIAKDWEGKGDWVQSRSWTIDRTGPTVSITGGPANSGFTNQTRPTFAFTAGETATYECSVDGGPYAGCTSPYQLPTPLSEAPHTFAVRAYDALNNLGSATARSFTVDTTPPDTTILSGPEEGSTTPSNATTFTFASPESGMSFECRIGTEPYAACTSPYNRTLVNGDHVFQVRAKDPAGNVDPTPSQRAWRVNSLDADADGHNAPQDCDDANPAIHPGAGDVAGDGVDQDCSGADATTTQTTTTQTTTQQEPAGPETAPPPPATTPTTPLIAPTTTVATLPTCRVPKLKGKTLRAARKLLTSANCALGKVTRRRSARKPGRVIAQKVAAGTSHAVGKKVAVVVSKR